MVILCTSETDDDWLEPCGVDGSLWSSGVKAHPEGTNCAVLSTGDPCAAFRDVSTMGHRDDSLHVDNSVKLGVPWVVSKPSGDSMTVDTIDNS